MWSLPPERSVIFYFSAVKHPINQSHVALEDAGLINHSVDTALQARSNAFNIRTHRGPKQNTLASTPVAPTIPLNIAALDQFRNVGHNDADCIKVYAEPRLVNKIDVSLGSTSRSYSPETPMEGMLSHIV